MPSSVELLRVRVQTKVGEEARVHLRVQRLDPAVEALREAGELLDPGDRQAERLDVRRRRPGRHDLGAGAGQRVGQLIQPGLVVDADQRPLDRSTSSVGGAHRSVLTAPSLI